MNPLEEAIKIIEQGWCTANLVQDGKVCALGAVAIVELGVDTRLLDKGEAFMRLSEKERKAGRDYEGGLYDSLKELESVQALRDEIMTTEWADRQRAAWRDGNMSRPWDEWAEENPEEVVYEFNDIQENPSAVLEVFKYAAKRLDVKV